MGDRTGIPYADATWNPMVGCSPISRGCSRCYAARLASGRLRKTEAYVGLAEGNLWTGEVRLLPDRLDQPARWTRPRVIFACDMGDLFHEAVPFEFIARVYAQMQRARHHVFLTCTKRPGRRLAFYRWMDTDEGRSCWRDVAPGRVNGVGWDMAVGSCRLVATSREPDKGNGVDWDTGNVWEGTTVEDQAALDARLMDIVATPCTHRWLSLEPLLGSIYLGLPGVLPKDISPRYEPVYERIHWVVFGGEKDLRARESDLDAMASIQLQCREVGVPTYFKQLGSKPMAGGCPYTETEPPRGIASRQEPARELLAVLKSNHGSKSGK